MSEYKPFFTIVMPTRNRHKQIVNGVGSLIRQNFKNYEFILVDNSTDSDTQNYWYSEVALYTDQRFRYVRSGGLAVNDNFEFAFDLASGEYVLTLTDRMIYRDNVLEDLHSILSVKTPPLMMFGDAETESNILFENGIVYSINNFFKFDDVGALKKIFEVDSREVANCNINNKPYRNHYAGYYTPRCYNTAFSKTFLDKIRKRFGRLFDGTDPDTRIAYESLDLVEKIPYYDNLVNVRSTNLNSNAKSGSTNLDYAINSMHSIPIRYRKLMGGSPVGCLPLIGLWLYLEWLDVIRKSSGSIRGLKAKNQAFIDTLLGYIKLFPISDPRTQGILLIVDNYLKSVDPDSFVEWKFKDNIL